jgi:hypothetical protein
MRTPVLCVNPDGSSFRVTYADADELLRDGLAERDGEKRLRIKHERGRGAQSRKVGSYLAGALRRREDWALTMVSQMKG